MSSETWNFLSIGFLKPSSCMPSSFSFESQHIQSLRDIFYRFACAQSLLQNPSTYTAPFANNNMDYELLSQGEGDASKAGSNNTPWWKEHVMKVRTEPQLLATLKHGPEYVANVPRHLRSTWLQCLMSSLENTRCRSTSASCVARWKPRMAGFSRDAQNVVLAGIARGSVRRSTGSITSFVAGPGENMRISLPWRKRSGW